MNDSEREKVYIALRSLQKQFENVFFQSFFYQEALLTGLSAIRIKELLKELIEEKVLKINDIGNIVIIDSKLKMETPTIEDSDKNANF